MLRDEMRAPKLMPPGEVFVVETMRVLQFADPITCVDDQRRLVDVEFVDDALAEGIADPLADAAR
jgi:hypothetical protein